MKVLLITGLSFFCSLFSWLTPITDRRMNAKPEIPVCHATPATMAELAADPAFQRLHQPPKSFTYTGPGTMVTFSTPDGPQASGFLLKASRPSKKWLLVYQEWWGLNDNIKEEADLFESEAGRVDLFKRRKSE